jgi:hypothetical protein
VLLHLSAVAGLDFLYLVHDSIRHLGIVNALNASQSASPRAFPYLWAN